MTSSLGGGIVSIAPPLLTSEQVSAAKIEPLSAARTLDSVIQEIHRDTRTEQIAKSKRGPTWVKISWIRPTSIPQDEECEIDLRKIRIDRFRYAPGTHFGDACSFIVTDSTQGGAARSVFLWGKASQACYPFLYIREKSHLTCISIQSRLEFLVREAKKYPKR